ncbi:MAG: tetratricopeptide repeat protein, partial [Chloroflexales bacterium]
ISHQSLSAELAEGLPQSQRASIAAAFALSYKRLGTSDVDTLARAIWLAAAQLAPEPIDAEVLLRAGELDPTDEAQRDPGERALRRLRELGLIERASEAHKLHRLLAAYARSVSLDQDGDQHRAARGLAQTIQRLDDEGKLSAPTFREHIRHLLDSKVAGHAAGGASLLYSAGLVMYESEDYPTARRYLQEALEIETEVLGRRHRQTAFTLNSMGNVARAEGDYPTARRYLQEALEIKEVVLGRRHRSTAFTLHALGNLALEEEDYPTARRYLQEALEIEIVVLGRSLGMSIVLGSLGYLAQAEGDYPTARRYLQEALEIKEAVLGHRHRETAITLNSLGRVAQAEGDYPTARRYFQEDLEISEAVLGRRHHETAITVASRRNLLWNALFETGFCAFMVWVWLLWLPAQLNLVATLLILGLGIVGYRWWRPATWVVRAIWRISIGSVLPLILLIPIKPFLGSISAPAFILIAVLGGIIGLFWPWILARPPIRTARSRMRRQWYLITVRLQTLRRRKRTPSPTQENPNV